MKINIDDRWPTLQYMKTLFLMYLGVGGAFGLLFLLAVALLFRPVGAAIYLGGVATGCLGFLIGRRVLRGVRLRQPWRHHPA